MIGSTDTILSVLEVKLEGLYLGKIDLGFCLLFIELPEMKNIVPQNEKYCSIFKYGKLKYTHCTGVMLNSALIMSLA